MSRVFMPSNDELFIKPKSDRDVNKFFVYKKEGFNEKSKPIATFNVLGGPYQPLPTEKDNYVDEQKIPKAFNLQFEYCDLPKEDNINIVKLFSEMIRANNSYVGDIYTMTKRSKKLEKGVKETIKSTPSIDITKPPENIKGEFVMISENKEAETFFPVTRDQYREIRKNNIKVYPLGTEHFPFSPVDDDPETIVSSKYKNFCDSIHLYEGEFGFSNKTTLSEMGVMNLFVWIESVRDDKDEIIPPNIVMNDIHKNLAVIGENSKEELKRVNLEKVKDIDSFVTSHPQIDALIQSNDNPFVESIRTLNCNPILDGEAYLLMERNLKGLKNFKDCEEADKLRDLGRELSRENPKRLSDFFELEKSLKNEPNLS